MMTRRKTSHYIVASYLMYSVLILLYIHRIKHIVIYVRSQAILILFSRVVIFPCVRTDANLITTVAGSGHFRARSFLS